MGCGVSKAENGGEVVPAKLRPLLRRRFEEIKTRKASGLKRKGATLSKKQLLKDGVEADDSCKNVSSPEDSVVAPPLSEPEMTRNEVKEGNLVDVPTPRSAKVAPEPESNEPIKDQKDCHDKDRDDDNEIVDKELDAVEEELELKAKDWEGEEDEEEGRLSNVEDEYICHGSPSFRVYCIDQSWDDTKDESECTS